VVGWLVGEGKVICRRLIAFSFFFLVSFFFGGGGWLSFYICII